MISHPPTFVLIGLGLALVAMIAVGFHWLATKDRPTHPLPPSRALRLVAPPARASPMSMKTTNGKRSRRIRIMFLRQRTKPSLNRTTAISTLADTKSPSTHPL